MRRFEMKEGTASKFWEVSVDGNDVVVRFGRIGTDGQTKRKAAASPAAAQSEVDKLVREKTGKGYVEIGASGAPATTSTAVRATPAKPKATKAVSRVVETGAFAVTKELDALLEKGWPWIRTLTDEPVTPAKATSEAVKGLNAIDPYFPAAIPRETARRYVRGYRFKSFSDDLKERVAADDGPVDLALLEWVLEEKWGPSKTIPYGMETYNFRMAEMVFLFEAFLGTEVVANALVDHLVRARDNPDWWGTFLDHHHQAARRLAPIVGWLRFRMTDAAWKELVAPLRGSSSKKLPTYCLMLNELANDDVETTHLWFMLQRKDAKSAKTYNDAHPQAWNYDPQYFFLVGAEELETIDLKALKKLPKWLQLRLIDELGSIRGPGAERLVRALVESRAASKQATAWLAARGIDVGDAKPPPKASKKELERQVLAIFEQIETQLAAQKGDVNKELEVLQAAFASYTELRAALDEVIPEAYFTHHFADVTPEWKADPKTAERWIDLAVKAAGG